MQILNQAEILIISGANPAYVVFGVGVATYTGAAAIVNATQTLNGFGNHIGEFIYNAINPDPLGKMVFSKEDFK